MAGERIGALWTPKSADAKAKLSGTISIAGIPIRIAIFPNVDDKKVDRAPQYHVVSYGIDDRQKADNQPQAQAADRDLPF